MRIWTCSASARSTFSSTPRWCFPRTTPFGVSNQFMLSVKGHSLFHHAVASLPRAYVKWGRVWPRHLRVLTTAGPLFLTGRLREHGTREGMRFLSLDEHGHGDPEAAYVAHLRGNTWAAGILT